MGQNPPDSGCIHHQPASPRFRLTTLALSTALVVWGCAGQTGTLPATAQCSNTTHTKVSTAKPTVKVSYTEPSVTSSGSPLKDLAKTTIYYDLGNGRIPAKEVPATKPTGGGQISQTITVPTQAQGGQAVRICVTATDRQGKESAMTP